MKRIIMGIGAVFAMGATIVLSIFIFDNLHTYTGNFLLINNASEPIVYASVVICNQTIEMKNITPTKSGHGSYTVRGDSHYDIRVEFKSGKKFHKKTGYVTRGFDYYHEIIVTDKSIEMSDLSISHHGHE